MTGPGTATRLDELTPQELQIARAVGRGLNNVEAAAALFVSRKTVEAHLTRAYRKLGVRSRTELTRVLLAHDASDLGRLIGISRSADREFPDAHGTSHGRDWGEPTRLAVGCGAGAKKRSTRPGAEEGKQRCRTSS